MNVLCSVCNHFTLSVVPLVRNRLVLSVVHFVVCVIIWFSVSFILCEMILLPTPFSPSLLISTLLSTNINFIAISSGQPPKSPFSVFASSAVLNVQTVAISTFSAGSIDSRRTLSCFLLTVSSCFYPCSLLAVTSCFLWVFFSGPVTISLAGDRKAFDVKHSKHRLTSHWSEPTCRNESAGFATTIMFLSVAAWAIC